MSEPEKQLPDGTIEESPSKKVTISE